VCKCSIKNLKKEKIDWLICENKQRLQINYCALYKWHFTTLIQPYENMTKRVKGQWPDCKSTPTDADIEWAIDSFQLAADRTFTDTTRSFELNNSFRNLVDQLCLGIASYDSEFRRRVYALAHYTAKPPYGCRRLRAVLASELNEHPLAPQPHQFMLLLAKTGEFRPRAARFVQSWEAAVGGPRRPAKLGRCGTTARLKSLSAA
jgi:hypothetical protein